MTLTDTDAPRAAVATDVPVWLPMTPMHARPRRPVIDRAEGIWVTDESGYTYLDAMSGLWNVQLGYGHPDLVRAATEQLTRLPYAPLFEGRLHRPAIDLAAALLAASPMPRGRVFYSSSGSTAIDTALKLARRYQRLVGHPERDLVVGLDGSYHGSMYGSMALSGDDLEQREYGADQRNVRHVSALDGSALRALAAEHPGRIAAIAVEPVIGGTGHVLPADLLRAIDDVRADQGALLVVDEVATGFGRTGTLFACEQLAIQPDLVALSKGITSGYLPLAATLCTPAVCAAFDRTGTTFLHGETQSGNPVACAVALATLAVLQRPGFLDHVRGVAEHLSARLDALAGHDLVTGHRGLGLMRAVQLVDLDGAPLGPAGVARAVDAIAREGVLVYPSHGGIALLPPLVIDVDGIDVVVDAISAALDEVAL